MSLQKNSRLVYSTEGGRLCKACGQAVCQCRQQQAEQAVGDGRVRLRLETKGRKGKAVTLVSGLPLSVQELKPLTQRLKQLCGSGGTLRDGIIEIQGDHRERLQAELEKLGFKPLRAGA